MNPHNAGGDDLVMRHSFEPASDFVLTYVETLGHLTREARTDRQGELPVVAAFAAGHATGTRTYAARVPRSLQRRVLLPAGARVARAFGYDVRPVRR